VPAGVPPDGGFYLAAQQQLQDFNLQVFRVAVVGMALQLAVPMLLWLFGLASPAA